MFDLFTKYGKLAQIEASRNPLPINWNLIRQEAFTSIRRAFKVETLIAIETEGNYTPVSGDMISRIRHGVE